MMLIGLAGSAGTGKDTVADYLVAQYGFTKFSFSDALYREVSEAFGVPVEELQDREKKERPHQKLTPDDCKDVGFYKIMLEHGIHPLQAASPRWVLQRWGTEYRRAQDPDYWLKQAALWVQAWLDVTADDGQYHAGLVNTSVRFPNEQAWINEMDGAVWHVRRPDRGHYASQLDYVSEQELPVGEHDRVIWNTGTVEQLNTAVSLLLQAPFEEDPNLVVDPGFSLLEAALDHPHKLVMCASCHRVHKAYTKEQVDAEVSVLADAVLVDDGREMSITAEDYRGCVACGCEEFILVDELDANNITPVLYGEKQ